jgi:hypothetical protein
MGKQHRVMYTRIYIRPTGYCMFSADKPYRSNEPSCALDTGGRVLLLRAGPGDGRRALGRALWRPVAVVVAGERPEPRAHWGSRGSRQA